MLIRLDSLVASPFWTMRVNKSSSSANVRERPIVCSQHCTLQFSQWVSAHDHPVHCKKLSKYISQPVPTTGHNPDRYKWISLGYLFGSVQDDILQTNKYPCRSTPISSVCKLGCRIPFVLGPFIVQISLLVPVNIHSRYRFLPGCNWFSVLPWPHPLPCLHSSPSHTPCSCPGYTPPSAHPLPLPWQRQQSLLPWLNTLAQLHYTK